MACDAEGHRPETEEAKSMFGNGIGDGSRQEIEGAGTPKTRLRASETIISETNTNV